MSGVSVIDRSEFGDEDGVKLWMAFHSVVFGFDVMTVLDSFGIVL